jgi:hypothetical protein
VVLKALVEFAFFVLVGQGIVALFAGSRRHDNLVYRLFDVVSSPVVRIARLLTPRFVLDSHLPIVAALLLVFAWGSLVAAKVYLVKFAGVQ